MITLLTTSADGLAGGQTIIGTQLLTIPLPNGGRDPVVLVISILPKARLGRARLVRPLGNVDLDADFSFQFDVDQPEGDSGGVPLSEIDRAHWWPDHMKGRQFRLLVLSTIASLLQEVAR